MHQNATIASVVNEDQNRAASNLLEHEAAWIGYMVADGSWLDGIHCSYLQDFVEMSPSSSCTRLLNAAESDSPKWSQVSCDIIGPALCSYTLQLPRNCSCSSRYEILDGFCNPNDFSSTLCSVQSSIQATNEETCQGVFAPNDMPVYGDWSRETGFAYFHPDGCDETCIQQKCNNDPACKGYTWAIGAVGQFGAGSLKNLITSSQPWQGYECKVKVSTCGGDQTNSAAGNALMMPQVRGMSTR